MKNIIQVILICALAGLCASFISPATPHQKDSGANVASGVKFNYAFADIALDNPGIQADENIHAARKCGFCMGVSFILQPFCFYSKKHDVCLLVSSFHFNAMV